MVALTLQTAKTLAILVVIAFAALSILSALVIKKATVKLVMILLWAGVALLVWSQRASLQSCADDVKERGISATGGDVTCSFFGKDVTVPARP
jgi:hypothetical protein